MLTRKALRLIRSSSTKLSQSFSTSCGKHHNERFQASIQGPKFTQLTTGSYNLCKRRLSSETFQEQNNQNSHEQSEDNADRSDQDIRNEVLENAMKYVTEYGWSRESLAMSASDLGYSSVAEGMFQKGGADLILHFTIKSNSDLVSFMEEIESQDEKMKTPEFIRTVLEHRLRMLIPYISVWPQAMAILLGPATVFEATQELGKMVDDIWFHAGDKSTDFNWYTKRGLLAKLFVSTQLVMVKDQSPDFRDSWEFLDRRMKDIATFGKMSRTLQEQGQFAADVGVAGFTVMCNILGMGERRR